MSELGARRGLGRSAGLVALVARRDYLRTVRRRGFVAGTVLLPLALGGILFLSSFASGPSVNGGPSLPDDFPLLVVNESALVIAPVPGVTTHTELVARTDGLARLAARTAEEFYVVPATYPSDPRVVRVDGAGGGFPLAAIGRQSAQGQELTLLLQIALLRQVDAPPATQARVVAPYRLTAETAAGAPVSAGPNLASFLVPFAFTMLFVLSIFITSGYLLQSVTEEKENRVVEIILSSVPALPLMAGKILGLGAAGLTQVVIWVAMALVATPLLSDQLGDLSSTSITPVIGVLALAYFALGYLAFGAIFSAVGALAPGSREAQQYAGFFGFFAVIPLIFAGGFLTDLSSPIVTAMALIPLTAPAAMLMVLTLSNDVPWLLVAASLVSLVAFTVVATVASSRVFRATLLLYGVRPSARRIIGAIFARS